MSITKKTILETVKTFKRMLLDIEFLEETDKIAFNRNCLMIASNYFQLTNEKVAIMFMKERLKNVDDFAYQITVLEFGVTLLLNESDNWK